VIAESWYVQIAHEIGVLGLAGYLALLILGLWKLFTSPSSMLRDSVLVMMAGLIVVNLFIHGLADSTLSYMTAVLVGLAIGDSYAHRARS
jgi:O-antigen ligase